MLPQIQSRKRGFHERKFQFFSSSIRRLHRRCRGTDCQDLQALFRRILAFFGKWRQRKLSFSGSSSSSRVFILSKGRYLRDRSPEIQRPGKDLHVLRMALFQRRAFQEDRFRGWSSSFWDRPMSKKPNKPLSFQDYLNIGKKSKLRILCDDGVEVSEVEVVKVVSRLNLDESFVIEILTDDGENYILNHGSWADLL